MRVLVDSLIVSFAFSSIVKVIEVLATLLVDVTKILFFPHCSLGGFIFARSRRCHVRLLDLDLAYRSFN